MAMMVISSSRSTQFAAGGTDQLAGGRRQQPELRRLRASRAFTASKTPLQQDPIEWTNGARVQSEPVPHAPSGNE